MTAILELRDQLKAFISRYDMFLRPAVRFLLCFVVLMVLNGRMGYMTRIDSAAIVLVAALMCAFLPLGCVVLFAALFSVLHMYALSLEVALVGLVLYLLLFLLYFRFAPADSLVVVLVPLLCAWKIPYVMPIAMGLLGTPASAVSVVCGIVVYYLLTAVTCNAATISTMTDADTMERVRLIIDSFLQNKAMIVMAVAFAVTLIVVYLIRRMSIDYSWTIAIVAGGMLNIILLLIGDLLYETNMSVLGIILGNLAAMLLAKVIEFFNFCVDYTRTEKVQFEDDEYYYYVKAVPKMSVAAATNTVKRINTQHSSGQRRQSPERDRRVTTERTRGGGDGTRRRPTGRSVTISSEYMDDDAPDMNDGDDYEELF